LPRLGPCAIWENSRRPDCGHSKYPATSPHSCYKLAIFRLVKGKVLSIPASVTRIAHFPATGSGSRSNTVSKESKSTERQHRQADCQQDIERGLWCGGRLDLRDVIRPISPVGAE
jgi:hypothetical protein